MPLIFLHISETKLIKVINKSYVAMSWNIVTCNRKFYASQVRRKLTCLIHILSIMLQCQVITVEVGGCSAKFPSVLWQLPSPCSFLRSIWKRSANFRIFFEIWLFVLILFLQSRFESPEGLLNNNKVKLNGFWLTG